MKFRYSIIILVLACLISLSAVTASDDLDTENVSVIDDEIDLEVIQIETIDDLDKKIQDAPDNSTVYLENDISVSPSDKCQGIDISKRMTVDGKGYKIDGKASDMNFLFKIHGEKVVLKNIVFTNWDFSHSYNLVEWIANNGEMRNCTFINNSAVDGGSLDWTGINGFLINCSFINNEAENGGAIYWYGPYGAITDCIFINNTADVGGAAYITGRDTKLDNSRFRLNSADSMGGAIYVDGMNFNMSLSDFINNTAVNGGAIYSRAFPISIKKSNFTDNTADDTAGALYLSSDDSSVKESVFVNNTANTAGAIYCDFNNEILVMSCEFYINSADDFGGAVMVEDYANITGSTFYNNTAGIGGAVYSDSEGYITNSTFTANRADKGGAIAMVDGEVSDSTFTQNYANNTGGAISAGGEVTVSKSDFRKNTAADSTNNIYSDSGDLTIQNVTSDTQIISKNVDLDIEIADITYGESLKVKVGLPENITEGQITVKVDGQTKTVNVTGKEVTMTFADINSGNQTVQIHYECSDFNTPIISNVVCVSKKNVTISAGKKTFIINYAGKYSVTVKDSKGKAISGEKVIVYINNKKIKTATTNKNGVASITIAAKTLKSLKAGTKTLNATLSSNYNPGYKTAKVVISKEKTKIVAPKKTFKKSVKTKKYTITLKNSKNKVVKYVKVKIKVKGKTYTAKTNKKGKATFKITKLNKKGKFTAKITFKTTKYYKSASKKVKITIK